jgi:hypothetical protein
MYKEHVEDHAYRRESGGFVLDCIAVANHGTAIPEYSSPVKPETESVLRPEHLNSPAHGEPFEYDIHGRRVAVGTAAAEEVETF